ncbi:MBL fold metallo-hydrolase [uncultured Lacinutrix sp.]|uniref:MBL fold metallo-hydrolase n=1 Tax=uncultured Lacinutrix sp. TaxID=574032 RepID=UPI002618B96D|nr:MBL fold metallo-hydrolase [uncultured Lacinutrix sp.]
MRVKLYLILIVAICFTACKSDKKAESKKAIGLKITPIEHASFVIQYNDLTIYIDPTGGKEAYDAFPKADYVLITDIHGDHMNLKTLEALDLSTTKIISPEAVYEALPKVLTKNTIPLVNGVKEDFKTFTLETVPMYNLREDALKFHPKGRGNGYVISIAKERIYISGDTEDIIEMRNLQNITKAFVCMNLPYTMTVESAANAVLEFKPKQVYPYHYRGTNGLSDVNKFKSIVNAGNSNIEVTQLNWYSNK